MNLNDLRSNLLNRLGSLVVTTYVQAAIASTDQYAFKILEHQYDSSSYKYSF